jgi:LacI family transcriptional regulator
MSAKRPTLHDVAKKAGVSIKTVSRVVNDEGNVSAEVRERVEAVVEELHYVPNTLARSLKAGRGDTIGVVMDAIADPFFAALTSTVEERALAEGLGVVFGSTGFDADRERAHVERMVQQRVQALILAPTPGPHDYLRRYENQFPIVMVDRKPSIDGYDAVRVDDVALAAKAVRHLTQRGHRRIGFVGSMETFATTRDRLAGYHRALDDLGVTPDPAWLRPGPTSQSAAEAATQDLLALEDGPTAIFAANPRAAVGVVHTLHTSGRTDVAVVSFGDFPLAETIEPGITVMAHDPVTIGLTAMDRVLARLGGDVTAPADTWVDVTLVERGSGELEPAS